MAKFGSVTLERAWDSADLKRLLEASALSSEVIIIKPSWYSPHPANFSDADTLRMLIEALDAEIVVTESYSFDRQDGSMRFVIDGEEFDWRYAMRHPGWDWIREEGRWSQMRLQDRWFLDEHGFTDLFRERGVEYVNATEEVWQGRITDPKDVKEVVESKFPPVFRDELYGQVPKRLFDLRGSTLISFGRVKGMGGTLPSLTMKNMFGLIVDPMRSWWHGPRDRWLARSIVDVNKVYASLFDVYGVCEALRCATVSRKDGMVKVPWGSYDILEGLGVVALGPHLVSLDAVLCGLIGVDPGEVSYITLGEEAFGRYDRHQVERARAASKDWFPV